MSNDVIKLTRESRGRCKDVFLAEMRKYHKSTYDKEVENLTEFIWEFPECNDENMSLMGAILGSLQKENLRYSFLPDFNYRSESREFQAQHGQFVITAYDDKNSKVVTFIVNYTTVKVYIQHRNRTIHRIATDKDEVYFVDLQKYADNLMQYIKTVRDSYIDEE